MSITDLYDLVPDRTAAPDDSGDTRLPPQPIPIEHAAALAGGERPAATIGLHPVETEVPKSGVEPYSYLASRGNVTTQGLHPVFAERLSRALLDAEDQTGHRAVLRDLYRPPERQAQYYANYTQRPVVFGGRTYTPQGSGGGLAAAPGNSRHQSGTAADVERGPVLDYLHANAHRYGLSFLSGSSFRKDPVHIQLGGTGGDSGRTAPVRYASPPEDDVTGLTRYVGLQDAQHRLQLDQPQPDQPGQDEQPDLQELNDLRPKPQLEFESNPPAQPQGGSTLGSLWEALKAGGTAAFPPGRPGRIGFGGTLTNYDIRETYPLTESDKAFIAANPIIGNNINNLVKTVGIPFSAISHLFNGALVGGREYVYQEAKRVGLSETQANKLANDLGAMAEQEAMKPSVRMDVRGPKPAPANPLVTNMDQLNKYLMENRVHGGVGDEEYQLTPAPPSTGPGRQALSPEEQANFEALSARLRGQLGAPEAPPQTSSMEDIAQRMIAKLQETPNTTNYEGSAVGTPLLPPETQAWLDSRSNKPDTYPPAQAAPPAAPEQVSLDAIRQALLGQDPTLAGGVRGPSPGLTQTAPPSSGPSPALTPPASLGIGHNGGPPLPPVTPSPPVQPLVAAPAPVGPPPAAPLPPPLTAALQARSNVPRFGIIDFMRSADDANAGLVRYARRLGLNGTTLQNLKDSFRVYTGATSQTIADGAATLGRAEAPNFLYRVRTPYPEIADWAQQHPGFNDYLHMFDTLDEINMRTNQNANLPNPLPGPITVRGFTAHDAQNAIQQWERANPDFVPARDRFRENVLETRRFAAEGEYAIMTARDWAEANASNPNEVPMGRRRVSDAARTDLAGTAHEVAPTELGGFNTTVMVRRRINNEAVGMYVDEVRSQTGDNVFRPVTDEQLRQNPDWRRREVKFMRRGVTEHYVTTSATLADLLRHDPYSVPSGLVANWIRAPTRIFQTNTTGWLAPYFSVRDMFRNYRIAQATVAEFNQNINPLRFLNPLDQGVRRPPSMLGIRQTLTGQGYPLGPGTIPYAMVSQILPQIAKRISVVLDAGGGRFLRYVIGNQATTRLSGVLARSYMRSMYAMVEAMGTHAGSYMGASADRNLALGRLNSLSQTLAQTPVTRNAAVALRGYIAFLTAIHNNPQFAYIQRNARARGGPSITRLAAEARDLTGNPQVAGAYATPQGHKIRYDATGDPFIKRAIAPVADAYSTMNQLGRDFVPWYNMTQQGAKQIGAAFIHNPVESSMRTFLYLMLPSALAYYWNQWAGTDPNGVDYTDYMQNMRDEYKRSMFNYIAVPGRPAAEGIEFPSYQEAVLAKRLTEDAMHHLYGHNVEQSMRDAFLTALAAQVDIALVPPTPPWIQIGFAGAGYSPPQNMASFQVVKDATGLGQLPGVGGEIYKQKDTPFDQDRTLPAIIENTLRAIAPAIGEIYGSATAAWTHSPKEASLLEKTRNAAKQVGRREIERTDVLRDLANLHAPMNSNNRSQQKMFERQKEIEDLDRFFKTFESNGTIGLKKPISQSGFALAQQQVEFPPHTGPGMPIQLQQPTNPLYLQFMQQLYNRTKHDSTIDKSGGIGYRSLWDAYRQWTEGVKQLRNVDYGNMVTWNKRVEASPDLMAYLEKYNVDPKNPIAMRNLYERKRYEVTRAINNNIDAIEWEMSQQYGRPIKLKDLDPYNSPASTQTAAPEMGQTPPWPEP